MARYIESHHVIVEIHYFSLQTSLKILWLLCDLKNEIMLKTLIFLLRRSSLFWPSRFTTIKPHLTSCPINPNFNQACLLVCFFESIYCLFEDPAQVSCGIIKRTVKSRHFILPVTSSLNPHWVSKCRFRVEILSLRYLICSPFLWNFTGHANHLHLHFSSIYYLSHSCPHIPALQLKYVCVFAPFPKPGVRCSSAGSMCSVAGHFPSTWHLDP